MLYTILCFKHNLNITAQILTFDICLFVDPVVCELPQQQQSWLGNRERRYSSWLCPSNPRHQSNSSQPGRGTEWRTTGQRPQHQFSSAYKCRYTWTCRVVFSQFKLAWNKEVVTAYLADPAKKIAVRQVNRPTETTASWLSLPCCHTSLAFSRALFGSSSNRPWYTGTSALLSFLGVDSMKGLGGEVIPPLNVCGPLGERGWSGNSKKTVATKKAQIRKASARNSVTPTGEDRE